MCSSDLRGVATGLVQGTPGGQGGTGTGTGTQGAGAGGTTSGAGGAGTGTSGIVLSTAGAGPSVPQFDPTVTSNLSEEHAISPQANQVFTGVPNLQSNTGTVNFSYNQGFSPGTSLSVGFQNNRQTTNSRFNTLNPTLNSSFRATITQHLLRWRDGKGFHLRQRCRSKQGYVHSPAGWVDYAPVRTAARFRDPACGTGLTKA